MSRRPMPIIATFFAGRIVCAAALRTRPRRGLHVNVCYILYYINEEDKRAGASDLKIFSEPISLLLLERYYPSHIIIIIIYYIHILLLLYFGKGLRQKNQFVFERARVYGQVLSVRDDVMRCMRVTSVPEFNNNILFHKFYYLAGDDWWCQWNRYPRESRKQADRTVLRRFSSR